MRIGLARSALGSPLTARIVSHADEYRHAWPVWIGGVEGFTEEDRSGNMNRKETFWLRSLNDNSGVHALNCDRRRLG